jgi:hypothetical protein
MSFKKGYKGFNIVGDKMFCRNMEYTVGETYTLEGELIICENGFHFCEHLIQCFEYYNFADYNIFCEVEAIGDVVYEEPTKQKAATNKMKIIKVLDKDYILSLFDNKDKQNTGDYNTGNWNACNKETGFFNTEQPKTINVFNKPCDIIVWENAEKPDFIYFDVVPELGYKGSFQKSFDTIKTKAKDKQITLLKQLPNFDKEVFFEISGIFIE